MGHLSLAPPVVHFPAASAGLRGLASLALGAVRAEPVAFRDRFQCRPKTERVVRPAAVAEQ